MGKIEDAVKLAVKMAGDNSHGYSQSNRWGPDYDCSSFIIYVWQSVGVPVKANGATYTGNMLSAFLQSGFKTISPVFDSLQPGDVLLNVIHHTAMYIGDGKIVQATIAETGTVTGTSGDQTGKEICISPYYDYPWDHVLRYVETSAVQMPVDEWEYISYSENACKATQMPQIWKGDYGPAVSAMQGALKYHGFYKGQITGGFGLETLSALKAFQNKHKLETDGICGPLTWNELMFWR